MPYWGLYIRTIDDTDDSEFVSYEFGADNRQDVLDERDSYVDGGDCERRDTKVWRWNNTPTDAQIMTVRLALARNWSQRSTSPLTKVV